jgi:hypothetical protein
MERGQSYVYPIQSHEYYDFQAGMTGDGRSVLMGLLCPYLVAISFDAQGNLREVQRRFLEFLQASGMLVDREPIDGQVRSYNIYDERIPERLAGWQREIGFSPSTIRVKRFFVPDLGVGVQDCPAHFAEILADPDETEEEKDSIRESLREWETDGQFVLLWGNDYWLDSRGEVTSS